MRLTAFSDVSLRAMMLLVGVESGHRLTTQQVAEAIDSPYHHVTKAVARLRSLGLVDAARGRSGGVAITPAGGRETVGRLLRELEGDQPMVECEASEGTCPLDSSCRLRAALGKAREAFYATLDDIVISDLPHARQMGPVMLRLGLTVSQGETTPQLP